MGMVFFARKNEKETMVHLREKVERGYFLESLKHIQQLIERLSATIRYSLKFLLRLSEGRTASTADITHA